MKRRPGRHAPTPASRSAFPPKRFRRRTSRRKKAALRPACAPRTGHEKSPRRFFRHGLFLQRENGARALRLEFVGATAQQPIINHLIREYAVEVNILFASMSEVQGRILGFMIVQLLGEPDETERAITHLVDAGVKITHV